MIILLNDSTVSRKKARKQAVKKTNEAKIKAFAFRLTNFGLAEEIAKAAQHVGLSVETMYVDRGYYITFGLSSKYDVSYAESRRDIPAGTKILDDFDDIVEAVRYMAKKKREYSVIDAIRVGRKTYRELAMANAQYKVDVKKEKKSKKINYDRLPYGFCECVCEEEEVDDVYEISVSDNFVIDSHGNYAFKGPNDVITELRYYVS
jgi:AAA15 family ATPase/GTPase